MSRVYGEKRDIKDNNIKDFWNKRALRYNEEKPYVSIKLGDTIPERAESWDKFEKENIIPILDISGQDKVLDIRCGVGRLSDTIIPLCNYYLGTDYAESLIEIAKKRSKFNDRNYSFHAISFQDINYETISKLELGIKCKFNIIILDGILPYINDADISSGLCKLTELADEECKIYIETAIGNERLTLDNIFSDDLQSNYSAIYRTNEEYLEFFEEVLFKKRFYMYEQGEIKIPTFNNSETKRVYYILKKGKNGLYMA